MATTRFQRNVIILVAVLLTFFVGLRGSTKYGSTSAIEAYYPNIGGSSISSSAPRSPYAYAVYLNANANSDTAQQKKIDLKTEDHYFMGARMLMYQLLYDPETRTNNSIPFVALVSQDYPQVYRDQLTSEGAIVKEVEPLHFDWIKPNRERWSHLMDKINVFKLLEYEKVLLLDSDMVVTARLDSVFDDPAAQLTKNLGNPKNVRDDESVQPETYIMAGNCGPGLPDHAYPSERCDRINGGFLILKPSIEAFNHYVSVASIEERFNSGSAEQNLWNYVHSPKRNMPWKQIHGDFTINTPNYNDYKNGVKSFHEKYWWYRKDPELRDVLLRSRWKMQGFFEAYHAERG